MKCHWSHLGDKQRYLAHWAHRFQRINFNFIFHTLFIWFNSSLVKRTAKFLQAALCLFFKHFPSHHQLSNHGSQSQRETAQSDWTYALDTIWVALSAPLRYHIIAVMHWATDQVNALSEINFATAVLHLHVLQLTLADLFGKCEQRGSRWREKRIMRDKRRRYNGNRPAPSGDFLSWDSFHTSQWKEEVSPRLQVSHACLSTTFLGSTKPPSSGLLFLFWRGALIIWLHSAAYSVKYSKTYKLGLWEPCSFAYNRPSHRTILNSKTSETSRNNWILAIFFQHMGIEVDLEAKCLGHCRATGKISLTCKMLTLKQRAWDQLSTGLPCYCADVTARLWSSHEHRLSHPCLWHRERLFTGSVQLFCWLNKSKPLQAISSPVPFPPFLQVGSAAPQPAKAIWADRAFCAKSTEMISSWQSCLRRIFWFCIAPSSGISRVYE